MFSPKFTITNAVTSALTQIERARGFLEAAVLSKQLVEKELCLETASNATDPTKFYVLKEN